MSRHPALTAARACVFDAYGTLLDLGALGRDFAPRLGDDGLGGLVALWRQKQLEYSWLRTLIGRHADFWAVTGDSLDYALAACGIDPDPALRDGLMADWLHPTPYPEVPEMLARLRAGGMATAILSNGSEMMLDRGLAACGLAGRLDAVLSVEAAGRFKPHPSVYALAVRHFGLDPAEICFVSSNGWDVAGAASFGFRVVWVNRRGMPGEVLPSGPDIVAASLDCLPDLLGA